MGQFNFNIIPWQTILNILATFSIPSIIWNVFLYTKNKNYRKLEAERDIELKKIEFEEEMNLGEKEYKKNTSRRFDAYRNTHINISTKEDEEKAWEGLEKSRIKLRKISTEIDYLCKISGKKNPFNLFAKESILEKLKSKFKLKK